MKKLFLIAFLLIASPALAAELKLTWEDKSDNESGFVIERGDVITQPDGSSEAGTFAEISRTIPNVLAYTDSTVTLGRFYCYRVAAFVSIANAVPPEARSTYSNIRCGANVIMHLNFQ